MVRREPEAVLSNRFSDRDGSVVLSETDTSGGTGMTGDDSPLDAARVLVTGASSGIGRATAREFASRGASVALIARREGALEAVAAAIETDFGSETLVLPTDVTDPSAVATAVERTVDVFDGIDVAVSNAGLLRMADRIEDLSIEDYETMRAVNIDGMFYTARAVLPHLRDTSGTLVFVGSDAAKHPDPVIPTYAATKWWTRGFALSLEAQEGIEGVSVTVVNPGDTLTEIDFEGRPFTETADPETVLDPAEVASAIAFAASQAPGSTVTELDLYDQTLSADVYGWE